MPTPGQLSSADQFDTDGLGTAIMNIVLADTEMAFEGHMYRRWPTPQEQNMKVPFLVVHKPQLAGYLKNGQLAGKEVVRGLSVIHRVEDTMIYVLFPYDPLADNSYITPTWTMDRLEWLFTIHRTVDLLPTCYKANPMDPNSGTLRLGTTAAELQNAAPQTAAWVTVRSYHELKTQL